VSVPYHDRRHAGRELASLLASRNDLEDPIVLALPRGGVPVGREIARSLDAPLDVMVVRKLGLPIQPELAMGAVASGGILVVNSEVIQAAGVPEAMIDRVAARELREVQRREEAYRGDRPHPELRGRTVILVDDGIATGSTMEAAVQAARVRQASRVIVAVPVAPSGVLRRLAGEVDEVICPEAHDPFGAISRWYRSFPQLDDTEVRALLDEAVVPGDAPREQQ
jgi:putative phosphoribosyl transferase